MRKASDAMALAFGHSRYVMNDASPTSYAGKWETFQDDQSCAAGMARTPTKYEER